MPPSLAAFERAVDHLTWWLEFWTAIVVVGLLCECLPLLKALRHHQWSLVQRHFGAVVVALGVAGELYVQFRVFSVETALRAEADQAVTQATDRARAEALAASKLALPRSLSNMLSIDDRAALLPFAGTTLVIVSAKSAGDE